MAKTTLGYDKVSSDHRAPPIIRDPETDGFARVEGPRRFATWEEANEAGRFLTP